VQREANITCWLFPGLIPILAAILSCSAQSNGGSGSAASGSGAGGAAGGYGGYGGAAGQVGGYGGAAGFGGAIAGGGGSAGSIAGGGGSAGAIAGSGGVTAGTGGVTAGSSGAAGADGGAYGGYISSGGWQGYAWTATSPSGGSISPDDFGDVTDFPLCASGSVAAGTSNVAMVGWNLNQHFADGEPALSVTPTMEGIYVSVTNSGGSELRLQIQGPNGGTDANDRWCAIIPGSGGFIAFSAFNTECWAGGNGTAYAGQPIVAAIVLVPGSASGPVSFDFCIDSLQQSDESGPVGEGCSLSGGPGEGSGTISGSETRSVTRAGRQYVVQNNVWNGDSNNQTLSYDGVSFSVTAQGNSQGTGGAPCSYPSVFIGSNYGHSTPGSNLPRQVSALAGVPTGWRWTGSGGVYNAAYDVWFSTNPGGDAGSPSGGYLMVWLYRDAAVSPMGSPQGTVSVGGRSWQVWVCSHAVDGCNQNGVPVITYLTQAGPINEYSFDLEDFIRNAADQFGVVQDSWYLTNIFAGFEIWSGGVGLSIDDFCAVVN
jgi:hypothetical protein